MIPDIGEGMNKQADWPPLMPWAEFAEWIRTEPGIVRGWVDKGYLPVVTVGRRRMVNVVALVDQLREGEV
jgi:hypothetical protein